MQKPTLVVNRKYVREMLPGADLDRMLATGDNLVAVKPKKPSRHSVVQKEFEQRRRAAGYRVLHTLLPEHVYTLLLSRLRKGENMASLLERLLKSEADSAPDIVGARTGLEKPQITE